MDAEEMVHKPLNQQQKKFKETMKEQLNKNFMNRSLSSTGSLDVKSRKSIN